MSFAESLNIKPLSEDVEWSPAASKGVEATGVAASAQAPAEMASTSSEERAIRRVMGRWGAEWLSWLGTGLQKPAAPQWPANHPLPPPKWGAPRPPLRLTLRQYEELVAKAEAALSRLVVSENYDSVNNFLTLYESYMASPDQTLDEFFPKYNPPIRAHKHTCVGLGMEVIKRLKVLEEDFPGITRSMMLVSCDENIQDLLDYTTSSPGPQGFLIETEKDHVMVAIHVRVDGRNGIFLSDLGYHISRVVTVMADRCYPHTGKIQNILFIIDFRTLSYLSQTKCNKNKKCIFFFYLKCISFFRIGWFIQSDEPHCRKEYNYQFNIQNSNYVEWHERESRGSVVKERLSLIYVARAYLSAVSITEKRNLVWDLR